MKALFSHYKKLHLWLLANLALLSAFLLARRSRGAMNALTEGFTNPLRRMLGRLCECVPFSVSEGLYVLAAMGFLAFLVLGVRAVVRSRHRSGTVYALVLGLGNAVLTVYVLFCLLWGANYYADSFTDKSGIDVRPVAVDDLERVTRQFAALVNEYAGDIPRAADGAFAGDRGPNTGGMGAFTPSPNYTPEIAERCMKEIFLPTMEAMKAEGRPFKGVIYFGLMLTADGPKVVEYNARFGDPETQAVLYQLDTDLFDIFNACVDGTLADLDIQWKDGAACCLVLASGGYPLSYEKGYEISGLDQVEGATVFHAGTKFGENGAYLTNGGRVLGVTASGATLADAVEHAYTAAKPIVWKDMHFRTDIGKVWVD